VLLVPLANIGTWDRNHKRVVVLQQGIRTINNSRQEAKKGKMGSASMDAWRGQSSCPNKGRLILKSLN
jgi:hypothetical protein